MSFDHVVKRNGAKVPFDANKITSAIAEAGKATGQFDTEIASILTKIVLQKLSLQKTIHNIPEFTIEFIQDIVEKVLLNTEFFETAKAYMLWRDSRRRSREIAASFHVELIHQYINQNDWKVKENSNTTFSLQGLHNYMSGEMSSQYWLSHIYPASIAEAHKSGDFHIHDLSMLAPYCCGWSLEDLLLKGFSGVPTKVASTPPKHFRTALGQLVNFLYTLQGEAAGAQAVSNFDTILAPFIRYDNLSYDQVKQCIQEFIFNMNIPTRVGFQAVFSNITLDLKVPVTHKDIPIIIGGKYLNETYSEFQEEMNLINRAFCEVMTTGDAAGRVFTFPIPTYNIGKDFDWDNEAYDAIWKMTGKYGIPYFSNFINSDMKPEDARSMCPLHPDTPVKVRLGNDVRRRPIKYTYHYQGINGKVFEAMYKGKWRPVKVIEVVPQCFCEVTVGNVDFVSFEGRHLQPVKFNLEDEIHQDIEAKSIKTGMYLPFVTDDPDKFEWKPVTNVHHRVPSTNEKSYCFEVQGEEEPYFELGNGMITHNCRLRLDNKELRKRGGGLFGANPLTGSLSVVTINLPRLGFLSNDEEEFLDRLDVLLVKAKNACHIKRKVVNDFSEKGMYPYSAFYLDDVKQKTGNLWTNHFNTIGINGLNEACLNLLGVGVGDPKGKAFGERMLDHIRSRMIEFQEESGELFNLEATPAEATSYTLALKDKKLYPEIISASSDCGTPFYTNSSHLPVNYTHDIFELLDLQDEMQTKYTGGTVIHLFLGEELKDPRVVKSLVRKVCENYRLPYFSLTPTFSTCDHHGYLAGEQKSCPTCGGETEIFSRVVGYYRPVKSWNNAKQIEFDMRKTFNIPE